MSPQEPFDEAVASSTGESTFVDNPEPRVPLALVLDKSGSMQGEPITQLNEALVNFKQTILQDSLARKRVEVSIVQFGPVKVAHPFATVDQFEPPQLVADGDTPMGQALSTAIDLVEERKAVYKSNGVSYYRPWIFLITDGAPTDVWTHAKERLRVGEDKRSFIFFAVGVEGADFGLLKQLCHKREPAKLKGYDFNSMFQWLSASMSAVSASQLDGTVKLPPPGWSTLA